MNQVGLFFCLHIWSMLYADEWLTSQVGGPANLAKLRAIKQQVDPGNVFRHHAYVGLWQQPELLNIEASAL